MNRWARFLHTAYWLLLLLLSEALPILAMVVAYSFARPGTDYRDIVGYTTTTLVAISILGGILIELTLRETYRGLTPVEFLLLIGSVAGLPLIYGVMLMADIDARFGNPRTFHILDSDAWWIENLTVLWILIGGAHLKVRQFF